jgi:ribosomal protein L21E
MNKSAAETKLALAKKLIRVAYVNPEKRAVILPMLKKLGVQIPQPKAAGADKVAVAPETEEFVRWVLSTQTPMSPNEVEGFVERTLHIKTSPPVTRDTSGPRFKKGDSVMIVADKHKAPKYDIGNYKLYNGKVGTVTETDGDDVLVAFQGTPAAVRFPGGQSPRGVGIYKYTAPYDITGSDKIEMIYFAGGKPTSDATIVVEAYMARAKKTEKRSANYYTGHVVFGATGSNGYYFRGFPQQRMQVDPQSEGGFQARTFNPSLGEVFYIGLFGKRPSQWKAQLEKLDEAAKDA